MQVLYKKLGAKLAVGMPFKDIATADSVFMRALPPSSDVDARRALKRLQVRVHVWSPIDTRTPVSSSNWGGNSKSWEGRTWVSLTWRLLE